MKFKIYTLGLIWLILSSCGSENKQVNKEEETIVFKDAAGHTLSKSDLANVTGQVNYEVTGDQQIHPAARNLHSEARTLGQAGNYQGAISNLRLAILIQPDWPYPPYDLAYAYLLKQEFDSALKYYQLTDQLAPKGFFTTKTAVYTLEGESANKFPKGLYSVYTALEWTTDSSKKRASVNSMIRLAPDFAPAWKELALLTENKEDREKAIDQGLSKGPDADTKGILLINKAILLNDKGKKNEAIQTLGHLIFSPDATSGNVELAKFTLRSMVE
jgi:tetratricopeptide (TPR) repeat protein